MNLALLWTALILLADALAWKAVLHLVGII